MPEITVGEMTTVLGGVIDSLNTLRTGLEQCSLDAEIDGAEGRRIICQMPVVGGSECRLNSKTPRVGDLVEAVAAIAGWAEDIRSAIGHLDPSEPVFAPPSDLA
jgi:hypothetical protein